MANPEPYRATVRRLNYIMNRIEGFWMRGKTLGRECCMHRHDLNYLPGPMRSAFTNLVFSNKCPDSRPDLKSSAASLNLATR